MLGFEHAVVLPDRGEQRAFVRVNAENVGDDDLRQVPVPEQALARDHALQALEQRVAIVA